MSHLHMRWHRLFGIYFALTAVSLAAGCLSRPPLQGILLTFGVFLVAGFVPLVMAIYFMRGFIGLR